MASHNGLNGQASKMCDPGAGNPRNSQPTPSRPKEEREDGTSADKSTNAGAFRVKSYYARTVEEALARAREEMGSEAVLVHSRKTPLESRHLGPYEVVFSYPGKTPGPIAGGEAVPPRPRGSACGMPLDCGVSELTGKSLSTELMQMRRQMEEIRKALALRPASAVEGENAITIETIARDRLLAAGLDEEVAGSIIGGAIEQLQQLVQCVEGSAPVDAADVPRSALHAVLGPELARRMQFSSPMQARESTANIVAFLGPPGAGKTTSLIKLALATSQGAERPIHLISADSFRIGATEQMKTFASILGVSIDFVDSPKSLAQAIEANSHKEQIFIDTPGLSGSDFELLDDLASYLGRQSDICKHLVMPATMRLKDMKRCLAQYEKFNAGRLVFTHLDETDSFGPLYCAALWSGKPLSYLSAGQQIPEDLEEATEDRVLGLLLGADQDEAAA